MTVKGFSKHAADTGMIGRRFGSLTVVRFHEVTKGHACWLVKCDCGNERSVRHGKLLAISKAGCYCNPEYHGKCESPEYRTWKKMKERCTNPNAHNYKFYGGRGITICSRWLNSFSAFLEDMGEKPSPRHSIERKDNNGPYCPENCVWATIIEQAGNRRSTKMVTIHGHCKRLIDWASFVGTPVRVIQCRLALGWDPAKAIFHPMRPSRYRVPPETVTRIIAAIRAERLSAADVAERFQLAISTARNYVSKAKRNEP